MKPQQREGKCLYSYTSLTMWTRCFRHNSLIKPNQTAATRLDPQSPLSLSPPKAVSLPLVDSPRSPRPHRTPTRGDRQRTRARRRRRGCRPRGEEDDAAVRCGPAMASTPPPRDLSAAPPTRDLAGLALAAERSRRPRPRHAAHAASPSG